MKCVCGGGGGAGERCSFHLPTYIIYAYEIFNVSNFYLNIKFVSNISKTSMFAQTTSEFSIYKFYLFSFNPFEYYVFLLLLFFLFFHMGSPK